MTNYERFSAECAYDSSYITAMTDAELAAEINGQSSWDGDLLREVAYRADMLQEYVDADADSWEPVIAKAAETLGVKIEGI